MFCTAQTTAADGCSVVVTGEAFVGTARYVRRLMRYKRRRGVQTAAHALRRQGISLETAVVLLARKSSSTS